MKVDMLTTWGIKCGVATYSSFLVNELRKCIDLSIIPLKNPDSINPLYFIKLARIAKKNADIVHVQESYTFGLFWIFTPLVYVILALPKRKIIVSTMHEMVSRGEKKLLVKLLGKIHEKCIPFLVLKFSDMVIVHTRAAREFLQERRPSELVVSNIPNLRIVEDANCGIIVDFNDVEKAIEEIIKYLKGDNSDHSKNAREYALKNLDWRIIAEKYLSEFEKVLSNGE